LYTLDNDRTGAGRKGGNGGFIDIAVEGNGAAVEGNGGALQGNGAVSESGVKTGLATFTVLSGVTVGARGGGGNIAQTGLAGATVDEADRFR
jgi:hypothetical protein